MDKQILKLEHDIANLIQKDNGNTVHFEYTKTLGPPQLKGEFKEPNVEHVVLAYTVNHTTQEQFLLKSAQALSKEAALEEILDYVKKQKDLSPFTVIWSKRGNRRMTTSYFYCYDIVEAIDKFFTGKDVKEYIIYEVKTNPIS